MTNNEANEKYLECLEGHIGNVKEAFELLCTLDIPFINENKNELLSIVSSHDESKYEEPEWSAYLHHFYPTCDEDSLKTEEFEEACRCHIQNNPHHWDYWVEDGKLIDGIDEHEYKLYTVERLCDHMAMSIQNNNKPADWYFANKEHIIMPDYGYEFYEDMLAKIPEDYDLSFHGTRADGKPEREVVNESVSSDLLYIIAKDIISRYKGANLIRDEKKKTICTIMSKNGKFMGTVVLGTYKETIYIKILRKNVNIPVPQSAIDNDKAREDLINSAVKKINRVLNESELLEAKASQLRNKTKSEDPARVKKSKNVKTTYIGMSKFGILNFKTTSESRNGYHYQTVEFQSLKPFEELIKKNGKIIPTDVEKAFNEQDINVYCSDESFTYWAWYHQAYQNDYAYIDDAIPDLGKRLQAPKVNNVRLAGALCKHLYSVLEYITRPFVLLAISDDMNNFLNQKSHKYAKQTVATQNWYDAVKQWTSEDALEYLGLTKEQIIMDLSKTLKVNPTINLDDFVDDLVKDAILKRKDDIDPKLERNIADKVIDELDLEAEYENLKPEEVEHGEEDIK